MTVQTSEIKFFKSATVSDTSGNGGRLGYIQSVSAAARNVFPDASLAERTAGSIKYRKLFVKVDSPTDEALENSFLFFDGVTPGDDLIQCFEGTQTDTQADISSPTLYGAGVLNATVLAGVSTIVVSVEAWAAGAIFHDGDTIRISDGVNEERAVIDGAPGVSGNLITLTLEEGISNGYSSTTTVVSSGLPLGDIVGSFDSWVETSAAGTYAEGTLGNVVADSVGAIEQIWTLTFSSATAFALSGNTVGAVGSGVIGSSYAPNNPNRSQPYFTILSAGWGGTWANGDTIVFATHPAAAPVWYKRYIPAGADPQASNGLTQVVIGESA